MKTAIITGVTGQDGSYLVELLVSKNYNVIGAVRDVQKARRKLLPHLISHVNLVVWDILDQQLMVNVLEKYRPSEFYNFAAYSSGAGMFDNPEAIGDVNGLAVARILEAIRIVDPRIRFCQASSREIFGEAVNSPQTEKTNPDPRSPYGAAKLYGDSMVKIYRRHHGIFACSAILFNHESPRRGLEFVTRKISAQAVKIKLGIASELKLGNLETLRDWGFAGDFVNAMWLMLQQQEPDDFVLATGVVHSIREFCEHAFYHLGLDYRKYIKTESMHFRPSESVALVGDITKAKEKLKWKPKVNFQELVVMMVEADLNFFTVKDRSDVAL